MGINIRRNYDHEDSGEQLLNRFIKLIDGAPTPFSIHISQNLITLKVSKEETNWWSPEMTLRVESEVGGTKIYELIGPNPATFTLSMFFVLFGAVVFIAAFILMLVEIQLDMSPFWAVLITGLSAVVVAASFTTLAYGRVKAKEQVSGMRDFVRQIIG